MSRTKRNPGSVRDAVPYVLGIDPSLTRSAAVIIPPDWELGDWKALRFTSYGEEPPDRKGLDVLSYERERIERMRRTADVLVEFASKTPGRLRGFVEGYGYNMGGAGAHSLAEFGGILRSRFLSRLGLALEPVAEASARKLLLGKLPPKDRKLAVQLALGKVGAPFNSDECDAFAIAGYGLSELGLTALSLA